MRILLLDNYDSFTWNLHHLLEPHAAVDVMLNDRITVDQAAAYDRIVISPGPGLPNEAGITMELIRRLRTTHPILGVCLGMQAIAEVYGGRLFNLGMVKHGVAEPCIVQEPCDPLFTGLPVRFEVGLYHSWAAEEGTLPPDLRVTARNEDGVIMALRSTVDDVCGVQFHPESILTPMGAAIITNWVRG